MTEIKAYIIMLFGALFTLLAPIQNFMIAMAVLFGVNFAFGLLAAIVNKEGWSTRKALKFLGHLTVFIVTACCAFIIGFLMDEQEQAKAVVKIYCYVAVYIFGTNIFRNWLGILTPGTAWYKMVDLIYYTLSVKFIERFSFVRKWQQERDSENR